jgi:hypothetical protein
MSPITGIQQQESSSSTSSSSITNISSPRTRIALLVPFEAGELSDQQQQQQVKHLSVNNSQTPSLVAAAVGGKNTTGSMSTNGHSPVSSSFSEEFNFTLQKLKREMVELKAWNNRLILSNSQLEDDLKNVSNKYEEEKKNRILEKKWYLPKIQKLEENANLIQNSFNAFRVNVDLLSNLYQHLHGQMDLFLQQENQLIEERNQLNEILKKEISKNVLLQKENQKKEKFVTIAMASRDIIFKENKQLTDKTVMVEKHNQQLKEQLIELQHRVDLLTQEKDRLHVQVDVLQKKDIEWKEKNQQLMLQYQLQLEQLEIREKEFEIFYEKEKQQAAMKYEKLQQELIETTSQNITLDARLRKIQEKINKTLITK